MLECNFIVFSVSRLWDRRVLSFKVVCMSKRCRVFPFTFVHCPSFLRTAYGNVVFFNAKLFACDKCVIFFHLILLPGALDGFGWLCEASGGFGML